MPNILDQIPTWTIMLTSALLIVAANEVGSRLGRGREKLVLGAPDPVNVVQGPAFTLVALLLGFSFALALGRYDSRRGALMREANAINGTFLRAQLLDNRSASSLRADLRAYVAQRMLFARADSNPQQRRVADDRSAILQRDMWRIAMAAAQRDPRSTTVPLFISELNDTIDASAEQRTVLSAHIPDIVIIGLLLLVLIASGMMGYAFGRQGQRAMVFEAAFAVMMAIALGLVLDLDRPQRGLIRINLMPLQSVQRNMDATAARPSLH